MRRRLAALALALGLLAGCSTAGHQISLHNASVYVQGVLDETYTGQATDAYYALVDHTEDDAQAAFDRNLEAEFSQRLAVRFELEPDAMSRELRADYLALLDKVYRHADYTVKTATALDDGRYCVELRVTPVTFFAAAYADGFKGLRREFEADHPLADAAADGREETADQAPKSMADEVRARRAQEEYEAAWAQTVYDYLYLRLDAVTTGPTVTKLVLVSADSGGMYTLSATDLQSVDDLILQY